MLTTEQLSKVQSGELTVEQAVALQEESNPLRYKVSEKGAVSVYGLNSRFPVTLYAGQWARLIKSIPAIQDFMAKNKSKLSSK